MIAGSMLPSFGARAADWPTHEMEMILAFSAGGGTDAVARMIAKLMAKEFKVNVQVKNVLGGSGLTGFSEIIGSKPDGYTFGVLNVGAMLVLPHIMQVPFKTEDVAFLGGVAINSYGIGASVNSEFKTMDDVVRVAKTRVVTYSTSTILNGFALMQVGNLTGAKFRFVAANSNPEAVAQAAGGHVDLCVQGPGDMVPIIDGGQLRLVASANLTRWPMYPDIKTVKEQGYDAATVLPIGFACPAKVPAEIRAQLEKALASAGRDPEVVEAMNKFGLVPKITTSAELAKSMKEQAVAVEAALIDAGMKKI